MRLKLENVSFVYKPKTPFAHQALENISLEIPSGQFAALIGATGSGKSTLVQHFNALLKPTSGKLWVGDTEITAKGTDLKEVRRKVGLVFQYPEHQLFEETVFKDVAFGPLNMGFTEGKIEKIVKDALARVNIDYQEYKDRSPFSLSGGEKRRVAIAGVLAMQPQILVLDEPTAGLDPRGREEILAEIRNIHLEGNITVVLVSHSMEDVARLAQRVLVMHQGKLAMDGTPAEIFDKGEQLVQFGLDIPETSRLLQKLQKKGWGIKGSALTISEAADLITDYLADQKAKR